jgi:hypothetical protein
MKFLLAALKTFTNSKDCSVSRIRISVVSFLCCHWSLFSTVHVIAGNFQNHRQLSEQLFKSQLPQSQNYLPEEGYWKDFQN